MSSIKDKLIDWVTEMENYRMPNWNDLPDIDLYMDQVITYLEKQLAVFSKNEDEKLITPAMINNYVKNEIIPRPLNKKYTREHMAHLISVLNLKNILSLMDINRLISHEELDKPINELFDQLNSIQNEAFKDTALRVRDSLEKLDSDIADKDNEERLSLLALKFSLEANANRIAAKKILDEIMAYKAQQLQEDELKANGKDKGKEKNKEKDRSKA
ncbi:MAG TPA: DUF1836 domain-containing protein [Clostridiaceae bacterium]|jgi:hypothetical protein|nr:DUF1836 domain-containing protein [Clostridiaceae bacterium]